MKSTDASIADASDSAGYLPIRFQQVPGPTALIVEEDDRHDGWEE